MIDFQLKDFTLNSLELCHFVSFWAREMLFTSKLDRIWRGFEWNAYGRDFEPMAEMLFWFWHDFGISDYVHVLVQCIPMSSLQTYIIFTYLYHLFIPMSSLKTYVIFTYFISSLYTYVTANIFFKDSTSISVQKLPVS